MSMRWLHQQFADAAVAAPQAIAVICGDQQLSYAELAQSAEQLSLRLAAKGVRKGDVVALRFPPSAEQIISMLAVLRCGAAWVSLDASWPKQRQADVLHRVSPRLLLIDDASEADASHLPIATSSFQFGEVMSGASGVLPEPELTADDLCYLMFTSGSTGQPNGVQVTHGNVAGLITNLRAELQITARDRWSALHSAAFGFSLWEVWGALSTGGTLVIVPQAQRGDPWAWERLVREHRVSVLSLTPSGLRQWLAAGTGSLPEHLRLVVLSGEALAADEAESWFRQCAGQGPRLVNTYALTETAGRVAVTDVVAGQPATLIGHPAPDADLVLVNTETMQAVSKGEAGELFIAGPMISAGYLDDASLTAQRFVRLDFGDGRERLFYRSGDLARMLPDGSFLFVGRDDEQIKRHGYRIEPADIEAALLMHPQVAAAAVVATGEVNNPRLHAFAVPSAAGAASRLEFWPSLGEYQIYDALLYDFMSADEVRVASYRRAFERGAADKVVLDIGTGKDALLARLAAQAGARHVYAVEVLPEAAASATRLVEKLGLQDRITVICGDMDEVELPERIDLCTQGIVGNIGSSDGIVSIWNSARRFFSSTAVAVPSRCTTFIAPASLPEDVRKAPAFGPLAADYARRIFAVEGRAFDVRLCVRNFPQQSLLAEPAVFEQLNFDSELSADYSGETRFCIKSAGWMDGYVLWTRIDTDAHDSVDFLQHQQAWLPVWFPLADEPVYVQQDTVVTVRWVSTTPAGQIFPDYRVETEFENSLAAGLDASFVYSSAHHSEEFGSTALHRSLLASVEDAVELPNAEELQAWLGERLPEYMLPDAISLIGELPLNNSQKLDKKALRDRVAEQANSAAVLGGCDEVTDALEQQVGELWSDVLGIAVAHSETDFFDAGGDSISAVRLTTEVQRLLDDAVFLAGLFEAPTLGAYCQWLRENHGEAVDKHLRSLTAARHDEFPVAAASASAPLSWAQQSLWFLQQLYPANTAANEQFLIRLSNISKERLANAWSMLVQRHDVLSTRYEPADVGVPAADDQSQVLRQCVDEDLRARMSELTDVLDLSASKDAEIELRQLAGEEIRRGFDLRAGCLLRPVLVRMSNTEWVLLVTAHHIVADGLCVPLIRDELFALYQNEKLSPPVAQFADYARWQRDRVQGDWLDAELGWWREQLTGAVMEPVLSTRPQVSPTGPETRIPFSFDLDSSQALRVLAREQGASLYVTLLTLWRVWLARCFEREDFLVGSPVTQRTTAETANMLGCLVNNVAFRNGLDLQQGFVTALQAERKQVLAALDHSTLPFEKIVDELQPERVYGRHPVFQFMFQFEQRAAPLRGDDGEIFAVDVLPVDRASYWDLELSVSDLGEQDRLQCFLGVRSDLFEVAALSGWTHGLQNFVAALLADPRRRLAELPLLSKQQQAERAALNDTFMPVPDTSLFALFSRQAATRPNSVAVGDDTESVNYAELLQRAQHCAGGLQAAGVKPGDTVGVHMHRGSDAIVLLLAINACGAAWLALDPDYPASRLQHMLAEAQPKLVVCNAADQSAEYLSVNSLAMAVCSFASLQAPAGNATFVPAEPADTLCILFTSGSTGVPKGVTLSQRSALSRCIWMWQKFGFGEEIVTGQSDLAKRQEVFGHRTSLNFIDAVWEIFGALIHGGRVDIAPRAAQQDVAVQARWITAKGITHAVTFPSAVNLLLEGWKGAAPAQLHTLIVTGEPWSLSLLSNLQGVLPHCRLLNTYGTSENWDIAAVELQNRHDLNSVPVGRPVANARVHILDRYRQTLPQGVPGQLYVGGYGAGKGYLSQPDLTAERFFPDPDNPQAKIFATGDTASINGAGELELHGRTDRQLKLRGVRVEPGEIEAIVNSQPGVRQSAVVLHGTQAQSKWLALYVTMDDANVDADVIVARLRNILNAKLPVSVVPADIVVVDQIPRTPSGKINVVELERIAPERQGSSAQPLNATEQALCEIWEQVLSVESIGRHDNFFAARGNSLLATRLTARICDQFNLDLPLACIFESPTVAELAKIIDVMLWADPGSHDFGAEEREVVRL